MHACVLRLPVPFFYRQAADHPATTTTTTTTTTVPLDQLAGLETFLRPLLRAPDFAAATLGFYAACVRACVRVLF